MTEIDKSKLEQTIPKNLLKDKNVNACAESLDVHLQKVSSETDLPLVYYNLYKLTSEQLDHLAYSWDASVWRQSWKIEIKRSVLKSIILDKRKRGTLGAVKSAIESIGSVSEIKEWWQEEPKGTPHTFTVTARLNSYEGVLDGDLQEDLIGLIDDAKPVRSHYKFILQKKFSSNIWSVGLYRKLSYARVKGGSITGTETATAIGLIPAVRPVIIRNIVGKAE